RPRDRVVVARAGLGVEVRRGGGGDGHLVPAGRGALAAVGGQRVLPGLVNGAGRLEGTRVALGRVGLEEDDGSLRRQRLAVDRDAAADWVGLADPRPTATAGDKQKECDSAQGPAAGRAQTAVAHYLISPNGPPLGRSGYFL